MRYTWFPWKFIVKTLARRHGFLDPLSLLAQMQRFAQPSEVGEPVELLRAGMIFHARGLLNVRAIQHNLDWVWPYWVQRQFDPADESFVPRAFSFSHINLTHRNWTAVGLPDCPVLPIVDPRGLVTPFYDGWSIDTWIATESGLVLAPSQLLEAEQELLFEPTFRVVTSTRKGGFGLRTTTDLVWEKNEPFCRIELSGKTEEKAWLVVAIRPYNPEGVNFIHHLSRSQDRQRLLVNKEQAVELSRPAERIAFSHYHEGDISNHLFERPETNGSTCDVGMATVAALFPMEVGKETSLTLRVPLAGDDEMERAATRPLREIPSWPEALDPACKLTVPEERIQFLYDSAVRTMVLHSPRDVYPGPYTYKRFWFRDAAYLIHALLVCGMTERAERALDQFVDRQTPAGYFRSQEGEWDSNGEAIWIFWRYCRMTGKKPKDEWVRAIRAGARWIGRKREPSGTGKKHAGLLPAGFSAEHLGPNDYYFWDDFWGVAGLRAAAELLEEAGDEKSAASFRREADDFLAAIDRAIEGTRPFVSSGAIPASPYRRMDAGAIGSIAVDYPLQLWEPGDSRALATADFLHRNCFVKGAFFQDMIHSGLNAYLTLHLAQVFLRGGDAARALKLLRGVAAVASPTGQWPEAIHPRTEGGCMGDGQHAWAAADWILLVRNLFVREEEDELVLASGIAEEWLADEGRVVSLGPTATVFGDVTVSIRREGERARVQWDGRWRRSGFRVRVAVPGFKPAVVSDQEKEAVLERATAVKEC